MICLSVLILLSRLIKPRPVTVLLILCVLLQVCDMKDIIRSKHAEFDRHVVYRNMLDDEFMYKLMLTKNIRHIVFLDKDNLPQEELYAFAELAARRKATINDFYFARNLSLPVDETALCDILSSGDDTLYVISDESYELTYMFDLNYYRKGDLTLGIRSPL